MDGVARGRADLKLGRERHVREGKHFNKMDEIPVCRQ
jgi:hypothetical protein